MAESSTYGFGFDDFSDRVGVHNTAVRRSTWFAITSLHTVVERGMADVMENCDGDFTMSVGNC